MRRKTYGLTKERAARISRRTQQMYMEKYNEGNKMETFGLYESKKKMVVDDKTHYIYNFLLGFMDSKSLLEKIELMTDEPQTLYMTFSEQFDYVSESGQRPILISTIKAMTLSEIKEKLKKGETNV